jgi:hypothetical protein
LVGTYVGACRVVVVGCSHGTIYIVLYCMYCKVRVGRQAYNFSNKPHRDRWMDRRTHRRSLSWYGTSLLAPDRWSGRLGVDASLTSSLLYLNCYKFDSILHMAKMSARPRLVCLKTQKVFKIFCHIVYAGTCTEY